MRVSVILLLCLAGLIHSTWNLLAKRSGNKPVFLWLSLVSGLLIFLGPFIALYSPISLRGWCFVVVSGIFEAAYFVLLSVSYEKGDFSQVYPLARGSAPLFSVLGATIFLRERISLLGGVGIIMILSGILLLHLKSPNLEGILSTLSSLKGSSSQLALLTGLIIASYSFVDKVAVQYIDPRLYIYLIFSVAAIVLSPYMLLCTSVSVREEWQAGKGTILTVAVLFFAAYLLVLEALLRTQLS